MARGLLAVVAGYVTLVASVPLALWLLSRLFPTFGFRDDSLFLHAEDILWMGIVTGVPALPSGYTTARIPPSFARLCAIRPNISLFLRLRG